MKLFKTKKKKMKINVHTSSGTITTFSKLIDFENVLFNNNSWNGKFCFIIEQFVAVANLGNLAL